MIKNYLKIAIRNLSKNKVYSLINIAGLGIGLACSILIVLWVTDELSYDKFHKNAQDIYRVVENQHYENGENFPVAVTPGPLGVMMQSSFPEIQRITRLQFMEGVFHYGDKMFRENSLAFVDSSFFSMFSFPFIKGNADAINEPNSIVLTEKMAKKYFGNEDPVGKTLLIKIFNQESFKITGVLADIPLQTHFRGIDFFLPFHYADQNFQWVKTMDNNSIYNYVQLKKGTSLQSFNKKIDSFLVKHSKQTSTDLYLQPLTAIHLHSAFTADFVVSGSAQYVYIFSVIALLVVLIACINFMNLSTARFSRRAKEVGVRKVVGALRSNLVYQFLGESIFMSLLAFAFAILLVVLTLPSFNHLSGKTILLNTLTASHVALILAIVLLTGFISGTYPAFLLSSFKPVKVFKGKFQDIKGFSFRKILVVIQFGISVVLIIGTLIISKQLEFIRNKRLGYDKENIVQVPASANYESFKNELLKHPSIGGVTMTNSPLTYISSSNSGWEWEGKDANKKTLFHNLAVDYNFFETFGMKMTQGRYFSKQFGTDSTAYIINEEALRQMKLKSPIGQALSDGSTKGIIVGVVQDFNFKSVHSKIEPIIIQCQPAWCYLTFIKIKANHLQEGMADIEKTWKQFNTQSPYEYTFLDQELNKLYEPEQRTGIIFKWFASLAIFISCLGLFGLISYAAEQRTKEIGIRKVLGASVINIVSMLGKDFLRLVIIANIISWPIAWWAMHNWLNDFAYRIKIEWWEFVIAGLAAVVIAIITISFQAIKAAMANPAKSLRTE